MSSVIVDRNRASPGLAVKAPVRVATTENIDLYRLDIIDGVQTVDGDRVLVKDQTNAIQNGIFIARNGTWERAPDWDGFNDAVEDTWVFVQQGTVNADKIYAVATSGDINIGITEVTFTEKSISPDLPLSIGQGGTGATAASAAFDALKQAATESSTGVAELATQAETNTGTDDARIVTPLKLKTGFNTLLSTATVTASGGSTARTLAAHFGDIMNAKDHGVVGDGTTDDTAAIKDVIAAGEAAGVPVYFPTGTYKFTTAIDPVGGTVFGAGRGKTIFQCSALGVNGFDVRSDKTTLRDFTVDLVNGDSNNSGSCFLFFADYGYFENLEALNANRQGFTSDGCQFNQFVGLVSRNAGHRGVNFSQNSHHNVFSNIVLEEGGFSGFLLGFGSSDNIVTGLRVSGFTTSPGVVVDMACNRNIFSDVIISDPLGTNPHLHVGAACQDNIFDNFVLKDVNDRGLLLRNEDLTQPNAGDLGLVDAPNARNIFTNFKILGNGTASTTGVYIDEVASEEHGMDGHTFENFYISDVDDAVRDVTDTGTNFTFRHFRFSGIVDSAWDLPTAQGHKCFDYPGVSFAGSLATATAELPAQPTYATSTPTDNNFPIPVMVCVVGQSGTGAGTLIDGVATNISAGNGTFIVGPGQSIECRQGSTGSGQWRWFALG
jgi:hypothetical protein